MSQPFPSALRRLCALAILSLSIGSACAEVSDNLLKNPSFEDGASDAGVPTGWTLYMQQDDKRKLEHVRPAHDGENALLIDDSHPAEEIGVSQSVPAPGGLVYQASAMVKGVKERSSGGAYLQLRFSPSGKYGQVGLVARSTEVFREVSVKAIAPPDTKTATVYLYSHRDPTPAVIVDDVKLVSGVEPPPPPPPEPVPPVYTELKDLHLTTDLVADGKPAVTIIKPEGGAYDREASQIQQAINQVTGVVVPIASDTSPAGAVPITGNLVVLGNRSTNKTIEELYNQYFLLTDLRYPGPEGFEVRSLHNPYGGGHNVIVVGGSDAKGVAAAADAFAAKLEAANGKRGELRVGHLMEIKLGKGVEVPTDLLEFETWEASKGYGSVGYFGWNSISKRMAMYYMTGDEFHAREAIRLAFPDAQALKEITDIDQERIENKDEPLSGPYHYNAHMMILYWDLIEESPVFTDEERLRVTNAFSKQLNHRKGEGIYGRTSPPGAVGSRHGQWSAISLYCLGRYFQKDYPNPIWQHCIDAAKLHFAPLHTHSWVHGESDNLFWYNTGHAPILSYMLLTGDREILENGVLGELLRGQEILCSGREPDWALNSASVGFLHKAAYLTQDGRWLEYARRTGVDRDIFRLGQSFWPEEHLKPAQPTDLVGKWSIHPLPEPLWAGRGSGLPLDESFYFGSYRSAADASGDFILLDGFNGASRNPYHTFAILELRLDGTTLLQGYLNQVLTKADGMVEPTVAMDAALRHRDVLGGTAVAIGETPRAAYCNWRRSLVQRIGKYALVVDDLTFRTDSENIEVDFKWQGRGSWKSDAKRNAVQMTAASKMTAPKGWTQVRSLDCKCTTNLTAGNAIARLDSIGITILRAKEPGAWLEMPFTLAEAVEGDAFVDLVNYVDRGVVRFLLDGKPVGEKYVHNAPGVVTVRVPVGSQKLAAGDHKLRVEVVDSHEGLEKCYVGLGGLSIQPPGVPDAEEQVAGYELSVSDPMTIRAGGGNATLQWFGEAKEGEHRIFFSVLSPNAEATEASCVRLADNAAALALPSLAVASVGEYEGTNGELVVLAADHLYGRALTQATADATLLSADAPVEVDWDFASGQLHLVAAADTKARLAAADAAALTLDGKPAKAANAAGLAEITVPAGRHAIANAKPGPQALGAARSRLLALLKQGRESQTRLAAAPAQPEPQVPTVPTAFTANVGGNVVDMVTVPSASGATIYAAEGNSVHVLSEDGKEVRTLQTDGPIRVLRWWEEHKLLLVGCKDEKVIAFDEQGNRKWTFVSEMDPAVFRAAKQYWFKSAPGHEGIHGLFTGVFLDGKSQAFVGSACTLEIIDENGKLVKRMPVFWGPGSKFQLLDRPDGSVDLLIARQPTDSHRLAIVNSKTLALRHGFDGVPRGHSYIGGWACMSRKHMFHDDLDGDGKKELVSEINGTWNRITVWSDTGEALYNAQFGPGSSIPAQNMRDLDIADLNGDGKKEIVTATSGGLVVALDCRCQKVWSKRLNSPATVLKCMAAGGAARIVVGCEHGSVLVLDGAGKTVAAGKVEGRPTCIDAVGEAALLATGAGRIAAFLLK